MLRAILALSAAALFAETAAALPGWDGVGWYEIETIAGEYRILAGPYETRDGCYANLPDDDGAARYHCQYFETQPDWDW